MALAREAGFRRPPPISWTSRYLFRRSGSCLTFANRDSSGLQTVTPIVVTPIDLAVVVHTHRPLRRRLDAIYDDTTELRGRRCTPDHGRSSRLVVGHCYAVICPDILCGPLFRCRVSRVTRALNHIGRHPITWPPPISGRDGKPRSDHNGVGNAGCMTPMRLGQLSMIQSNAILLHIEH